VVLLFDQGKIDFSLMLLIHYKNGGFMMESKKEIYDLIPQQYYPKNNKEGTAVEKCCKTVESAAIKYPFIAKPDIGLRGSGVKKKIRLGFKRIC
jgi:hypothetical protein